jgi:streptogramin lyase
MSLIKLVVTGSIVLFLSLTIVILIGLVPGSSEYFKNHDNSRQVLVQDNLQSQYSTDNITKLKVQNNLAVKVEKATHKAENNNNLFTINLSHIKTPYVKEYSLPNGTWPNGILVDKKGFVWTVGTKSNTLISFDPKKERTISSYVIKEGKSINDENNNKTDRNNRNNQSKPEFHMVWTMVEDKDGMIWFSQEGSNPLWRFNPITEDFEVIRSVSASPMQMKIDQKTGDIWYTTFSDDRIGVIQKILTKVGSSSNSREININSTSVDKINDRGSSEYEVTEFDTGKDSFPSGIFLQQRDSSVWITESLKNKIAQFKPISDPNGNIVNIIRVLEIPSSSPLPLRDSQKNLFTTPSDLVVFDNRSSSSYLSSTIWLAEHGTSFVTEYDVVSQHIKRFPTSQSLHQYVTLPYWIRTAGMDGTKSFWFNEHMGNRIAFFNTTDMTLTEYEVPTRDPSNGYLANALTIAVDPVDSDKAWFTEFNHDKIGIVDHSLTIPFDIRFSSSMNMNNTILVSNMESQTQKKKTVDLNLAITGIANRSHDYAQFNNRNNGNSNFILFKVSSSMSPLGKLENITAHFTPTNMVDLTKIKGRAQQVHLTIQNYTTVSAGNYVLGISASDDTVTKSIFLDLIFEK